MTEHWIKRDNARAAFWAWSKDAGADHDEAHVALGGVESVADFDGTMKEAKALIMAYVKGKAVGMSRTYGEMTEEASAEEARLEGAVKGMPEAPVLAWTKFQSMAGFEWTVSLRSGLQSGLALLALEQLRGRVTMFEELARAKSWVPLADPRNGIGARIQTPEKKLAQPLEPGTTSTHVDTSATVEEQSGNGGSETFVVDSITAEVTRNGKRCYAVRGGKCTQHGVTAWPEIAEQQIQAVGNFDLTTLDVGQQWVPPTKLQAVASVPEGAQWPNKVAAFAPAP